MPKKKKVTKKRVVKRKTKVPVQTANKSFDSLTLALFLITFVLIVFGAWYHKINWILMAFVPFLVAVWYEYMKKHM
jgi:hypothetical protein